MGSVTNFQGGPPCAPFAPQGKDEGFRYRHNYGMWQQQNLIFSAAAVSGRRGLRGPTLAKGSLFFLAWRSTFLSIIAGGGSSGSNDSRRIPEGRLAARRRSGGLDRQGKTVVCLRFSPSSFLRANFLLLQEGSHTVALSQGVHRPSVPNLANFPFSRISPARYKLPFCSSFAFPSCPPLAFRF